MISNQSIASLKEVVLRPQPPSQPRMLSFEVHQAEFCVIVGGNGQGKSFVLDLLAGLAQPAEGEVLLGEKSLKKMSERQRKNWRRTLGLIPSEGTLLPGYTVRENLLLSASIVGVPDSEAEGRCTEMINLCGLAEIERQKAENLSSGQEKRTMIARALLNRPRLILADDPFSSLDNYFREGLMNLFVSLPSYGYAIVMTTTVPLQLPIPVNEVRI